MVSVLSPTVTLQTSFTGLMFSYFPSFIFENEPVFKSLCLFKVVNIIIYIHFNSLHLASARALGIPKLGLLPCTLRNRCCMGTTLYAFY